MPGIGAHVQDSEFLARFQLRARQQDFTVSIIAHSTPRTVAQDSWHEHRAGFWICLAGMLSACHGKGQLPVVENGHIDIHLQVFGWKTIRPFACGNQSFKTLASKSSRLEAPGRQLQQIVLRSPYSGNERILLKDSNSAWTA